MDVVTGAGSYTGSYITKELISRGIAVRTLARRADRKLYGEAVEWCPLRFDRPDELRNNLSGVETLYNTYWIRYPHGGQTFADAVRNGKTLFTCAKEAGVKRVVHMSVTNPSHASPYGYFRGKALTEDALRSCGIPYAILRPTLLFGGTDVLINNIAWILRKFPVFAIAGSGQYKCRPIHVAEVAKASVDLGQDSGNETVDVAGPEAFSFDELVQLLRTAVKSRSLVVHLPRSIVLCSSWLLGRFLHDIPVLREELGALQDGLIDSNAQPRGSVRFTEWLHAHRSEVGRRYVSEANRHNFAS